MAEHSLASSATGGAAKACEPDGGLTPDVGKCSGGTDCSPLATPGYADATIQVLHQALQAAQSTEDGHRLDALAHALKQLSDQCHANAVRLAGLELEQSDHPLFELLRTVETQRARTIADAVHSVSRYVEECALGDLGRPEIKASWLSLWTSVSTPTRQLKGS